MSGRTWPCRRMSQPYRRRKGPGSGGGLAGSRCLAKMGNQSPLNMSSISSMFPVIVPSGRRRIATGCESLSRNSLKMLPSFFLARSCRLRLHLEMTRSRLCLFARRSSSSTRARIASAWSAVGAPSSSQAWSKGGPGSHLLPLRTTPLHRAVASSSRPSLFARTYSRSVRLRPSIPIFSGSGMLPSAPCPPAPTRTRFVAAALPLPLNRGLLR